MADCLPKCPKITVEKREHLIKLISETIEKEGPNCDLNFIDVSNQTDLTGVFSYPNGSFNGDISEWNVSSVTDMSWMFWKSQFRGDISRWSVPEDANMKLMFYGSPLELENRIPGWYK